MKFVKGQSGNPAGRPKGTKKIVFDESFTELVIAQLKAAVADGEQWAIMAALDRIAPKLRTVAAPESQDEIIKALEVEKAKNEIEQIEQLRAIYNR